MNQNFAEPYERSGGIIRFKLDLSNCFTKANSKGATGIDMSTLTWKTDLAVLKSKVDGLDVDKPMTDPADLSQLSNVMDNEVFKEIVHEKLVTRTNSIDTKLPSACGLLNHTIIQTSKLKKADYNTENTEIEHKALFS